MNIHKIYRSRLIETLNELMTMRNTLFKSITHLALSGKLNYLAKDMELDDELLVDIELFKTIDDINIQYLTRILVELNQSANSVAKINDIRMKDLE